MDQKGLQAVILAAGKGTRMQSKMPKILRRLGGKPLLQHTVELIRMVLPTPPLVIIPPNSSAVSALCHRLSVPAVTDPHQIGNAKSLSLALGHLPESITSLLVLNADDSFLYTPDDLRAFIADHQRASHPATILIAFSPRHRPDLRKISVTPNRTFAGFLPVETIGQPIFCGGYLFLRSWLEARLPQINPHPVSGEYQLTALFDLSLSSAQPIGVSYLRHPDHWSGVNTPADLLLARKLWKNQKS